MYFKVLISCFDVYSVKLSVYIIEKPFQVVDRIRSLLFGTAWGQYNYKVRRKYSYKIPVRGGKDGHTISR